MKTLLIVYHSQSGNTRQLADAAVRGAGLEAGVDVRLRCAFEAGLDDLLQADGVLFGTPENLGYMSGALKDFFDRTFYPAEPHQLSTPYALFISAGNDGSGAVREIDRILRGYPLRKVAEPLVVKGAIDAPALAEAEALGQAMAAALVMGAF
ncbi:MAG: flavodoxin family protein [Pseudomonadales bacterium]|nr:flavodoxin family protein [Pseudomonadales bacterium]